MKRLLAAIILLLCSSAQAVCTPNQGRYTIGATSVTFEVCGTDGVTWAQVGGGAALPSGMIAAFNGACPSGWTEVVGSQGRVIVGLQSGGTLAGTVGTAYTNQQNKSLSLSMLNHTHTVDVTDPGHTHLTQRYPTTTGGSTGFTADTSMSGTLTDNTLPTKSGTTGVTASSQNPAGGVASQSVTTSDVLAYVQYRYCSKD